MPEEEIGTIKSYFSKLGVAAVDLTGTLKVGDKINIKGATTDFKQTVDSIQIDREPVNEAASGASVGIKVSEKVRPNDKVYKITK